ncbi:MAG: class I tRNA ligase family protein, partial [Candidatus Coatesbacteria bacterium]|nr:class I tRNA ligase family protein [Candidatus Coatesbacteria bacterium]
MTDDKRIAAKYDPAELEGRWFEHWESAGHFKLNENAPGPVYTVVIPPPNITGSLHMGHALNNTIQDILVRWRR